MYRRKNEVPRIEPITVYFFLEEVIHTIFSLSLNNKVSVSINTDSGPLKSCRFHRSATIMILQTIFMT